MVRKLALLLFVAPLAACGPRSDHAITHTAATPTMLPASPAPEQPTGDPALKNGAVALGRVPPEIHASEWLNVEDPLTLRDLDGRPVLLSFCAIDNRECDEARAVLKDLDVQHQKWGFTVIELFVDQPSGHMTSHSHWQHMRSAINAMNLPYPAGFGERIVYTQLRYGFTDVPAAYLIDADGKLVWSGSPKKHEASLRAAAETIAGRPPM